MCTDLPRIFTVEGGSRGGAGPVGLGDFCPSLGFRGKAPVGGLRNEVPKKLKQNVKLMYNF